MRDGPIKPLQKGSKRNLLNRSLANMLINVANTVITAEGANGVTVQWSEGRLLISIDDQRIEATGTISFKGQWVIGDSYDEDDIVIRATTEEIAEGKYAGTYIASQDVPPGTDGPGTAGGAAYWSLFSKGAWSKLLIWAALDDITEMDGGAVTMTHSVRVGGETGARIELTKAQIEALGVPAGKDRIYVQKIETCEDGTPSYRLGLLGDPWPQV